MTRFDHKLSCSLKLHLSLNKLVLLHILKLQQLNCMFFIFLKHIKFHANRMLFTIRSINLFFMYNFRLQKI